jgi:hypothetical protein
VQTNSPGAIIDGGPDLDALVNLNESLAEDQDGDPLGMTVRLSDATTTTGNGFPGQQLSLKNVETAYGGPGDDTLVGSPGSERLVGLGGGDTIDGGGGVDFLYGGVSDDYLGMDLAAGAPGATPDDDNAITSRDGGFDVVDCGRAGGTVLADDVDVLSQCPAPGRGATIVPAPKPAPVIERVPVNVPTPVFDTAKATIGGFKAAKKVKGKAIRKNGRYSVTLTANEATLGTVSLIAKAGKVARIAKAGDLELATKAFRTTAGTKRTVRLTVAKKLRKLLKKGRRFTVVVSLVDAGGNTTTKRRSVKVG